MYLHTKTPNSGIFWKPFEWKMLVYFIVIWYIFPRFGMLCQQKSGNPGVGEKG
jgi:hypothetical protein